MNSLASFLPKPSVSLQRGRVFLHSKINIRNMSYLPLSSYIITPKQLSDALAQNEKHKDSVAQRIVPICASWFLPNDPQSRTGKQVYQEQRIPNARFFDLDAVKDNESSYPHMLPTAEVFAMAMQDMGIRRDDDVVIYDSKELGIFSAPRVGWTFKVFGHPKVHVLNNFRLWVHQGYPSETGEVQSAPYKKTHYELPVLKSERVVSFAEVKHLAKTSAKGESNDVQILDARSQGRWAGTAPEPRPGLPSGHIPGSFSVPLTDLLDPRSGALLPSNELSKIFREKGVDPRKPVISSCGTGVTAAVIDAALDEAKYGQLDDRRLYDGSWTEYAQRAPPEDDLIHKA